MAAMTANPAAIHMNTNILMPMLACKLTSDTDVAAFCDDLVKDSRTNADIYRESISGKSGPAER